ncbi:DUF948 domain-containing protein [Rossellomorea vietnamensis]|uniref:DUF948 domain-containing protein n=1 Tax=Rossellomorea vietnamensis TaxID=218284 RepID=UPI00077C74E8|nr:DUF948 domain-containing protein [Rossellomorea vietnamensis]OXS62030.1 hypothetical protein B1B00_07135 [Bacillus sp. DSM 27956]PRX77317.1 uncharacterized protein YoxC [Bacillus sp. V-88]SLK19723.1 Uncharacterized protein YoxC, contains an MCP-like domain [Bacillus sp. V-88]
MWIVYASIALFVISLIMLGVALMRTLKTTRPIVNEMNQRVATIQSRMEKISSESTQLQETQGEIQHDIEYKKSTFTDTIQEVKRTPEVLKEFVKSMKR